MLSLKSTLSRLSAQVGIIILLFTFTRILFIVFNHGEFTIPAVFSYQFLKIIFGGMRFDVTVFAMTNGLLLILMYFPLHYLSNMKYQRILGMIFVVVNSMLLLLNFIDIAYYPYVQKRMQKDVLQFMDGKHGNEFYDLLPTFLLQFWYLILIFLFVIYILWIVNKWIQTFNNQSKTGIYQYLKRIVFFISMFLLLVISFRGGLQYRPIEVITATEMADPGNIPIVLNTPFTMIKSFENSRINWEFLDKDQIPDIESMIVKSGFSKNQMQRKNIMILIVESLSRKYIGYYNGKPVTPFLDSLMGKSIIFDNAFANAKTSMEGIPSILASIPAWMDDPFIYSFYSGNKITSFSTLLMPYGYSSAFFHGGKNGTMGFDNFCNLAEIDKYYGLNEYPDKGDFDGKWGIWDEPYLQYTVDQITKMQQPFFASIFTLNTHHPFTIPEKYREIMQQPGHPLNTCIRYADYSLEQFFKKAKKQNWYKNTIFVITADHTALDIVGEKPNAIQDYRIPLIILDPEGKFNAGKNENIVSQIDILPTIMDLIDYPDDFICLGKSVLNNEIKNSTVNYKSGVFQMVNDHYLFQFNGSKCIGLFDWKKDNNIKKKLNTNKYKEVTDSMKNILVDKLSLFRYGMENNAFRLENAK
jgi:phosphoglycerol transferase MdoB-like AlkP superfamily enzyme